MTERTRREIWTGRLRDAVRDCLAHPDEAMLAAVRERVRGDLGVLADLLSTIDGAYPNAIPKLHADGETYITHGQYEHYLGAASDPIVGDAIACGTDQRWMLVERWVPRRVFALLVGFCRYLPQGCLTLAREPQG